MMKFQRRAGIALTTAIALTCMFLSAGTASASTGTEPHSYDYGTSVTGSQGADAAITVALGSLASIAVIVLVTILMVNTLKKCENKSTGK